jgi:hypothetical protein
MQDFFFGLLFSEDIGVRTFLGCFSFARGPLLSSPYLLLRQLLSMGRLVLKLLATGVGEGAHEFDKLMSL